MCLLSKRGMRRKSFINNKKWPRWGSSKFMWLSNVLLGVITFPFDCPSTEQLHVRPQLSKTRTGKARKKKRMEQGDCSAEARTQLPDISSRFRLRQWERLRSVPTVKELSVKPATEPGVWTQRRLRLQLFVFAGERCQEVTRRHSAATPSSSADRNSLTHWPWLVKQHAKSCLPPVAACEECSKLRPPSFFFFLFPPLQAKHVLPHYVLVCARPRLLTQTRCNLFNPPLSWADKAWPPNTLLHLTQPRGIVFHFITSSSAAAYRFGEVGWAEGVDGEAHFQTRLIWSAHGTREHAGRKKKRSETHTPRLILLTRPLNVITCRNVKLKIHIPADPWSSHNWHTSIFFCCGYWLMKLKANEIISLGEDIRGSIFRRTYNDYRPPPTPTPHLTSFLRQRSFTFT